MAFFWADDPEALMLPVAQLMLSGLLDDELLLPHPASARAPAIPTQAIPTVLPAATVFLPTASEVMHRTLRGSSEHISNQDVNPR
jgi:hypothetical protein